MSTRTVATTRGLQKMRDSRSILWYLGTMYVCNYTETHLRRLRTAEAGVFSVSMLYACISMSSSLDNGR